MLSPAGRLTFGVRGAADDVGQFGLQAGVGGAVLARRLVAAGAQRQHALQRRVGPQALALVDGQRRGVVDEESSVLGEEEEAEASVNVGKRRLFSSFPKPVHKCRFENRRLEAAKLPETHFFDSL